MPRILAVLFAAGFALAVPAGAASAAASHHPAPQVPAVTWGQCVAGGGTVLGSGQSPTGLICVGGTYNGAYVVL